VAAVLGLPSTPPHRREEEGCSFCALENQEDVFIFSGGDVNANITFFNILAYCIMGNYFHLLVRMYPEMGLSSEGFKKKYVLYYGKRKKRQADYATSTDKAAIFRIICFPSAVKIFKRIR